MEHLSKTDVDKLSAEIIKTVKDLDIDEKKNELGNLKTKSLAEDFWNVPESAKKVMKRIDTLESEIKEAADLQIQIQSFGELYETAESEDMEMLIQEFNDINVKFHKFQKYQYLSGKYDSNGAIISVFSGQGGTEADDWAKMLYRMYTRYFDNQGWKYQVEHMVPGTEAGISHVTISVDGNYTFGLLKNETGTHRLVRLSPFNSQNLRQTSFAGVEVVPDIDDSDENIKIDPNDIEFKAVRSSGAGGQSVNKTSSAVQITHTPTGISVHNSEHKQQAQNRKAAMKLLKAKLWKLEEEERQAEIDDIKGEHKIAGWGNQIRNYVLHPYKLVKDLRTDVESNNPEQVLDGYLDEFIDAEIRIS